MSLSPPVATSPLPASPVSRSTPAQDDELLSPSKDHPSSPLSDPIAEPRPSNAPKKASFRKSGHLVPRASTFAGQSPQLSERESIFALHYTPSQDELSTPAEERAVALSSHNKNRTFTEMEVAQAPLPALSINQVNNKHHLVLRHTHKSFLPELDSTAQDNKTATASGHRVASEGQTWTKRIPLPISKAGSARNSHPQQAMGKDAQEDAGTMPRSGEQQSDIPSSSLKQALQGQGTRSERSTSRGRSHIEKSIEATLANVEPGKNVRSRKASHVMGIFRENVAQGDDQKPVFRKQKSVLEQEEPTKGTKDFPAKVSSTTAILPIDAYFSKTASTPLLNDLEPPRSPQLDESLGPAESGIADLRDSARTSIDGPTQSKSSKEASPLRPSHDPYYRKHDELKSAKSSQPPFPASLLQEIREHHQVPPQHTQGTVVISGIVKPSEPKIHEHNVDRQQSGLRAEKGEDNEEHMYKMVYYPHPGPTAEEIAKFKSPGDESPEIEPLEGSAQVARDKTRESHEAGQTGESTPSEHIDISVHSKHGKSVFHGDYYPDSEEEERATVLHLPSIKDQLPPAALSTSESEPESGDEIGYLSQTDEDEITPTATPIDPSRLLSRGKPKPEGPKGAVVLQPYNHQVGGHSQIYALTKRAIMKQLNNRENEFYELIEKNHPDMLKFLPRSVIPYSTGTARSLEVA